MVGLFADVSDTVQIWTMVIGLIGTSFTAWIGYLMFRLTKQAEMAAKAVAEVKTTLQEATQRQANGHGTKQEDS